MRETLVPLVLGTIALAWIERPRLRDSPTPLLDAALVLALAAIAAQLVPLPPAVRLAVSPHAAVVDRALLLAPPEARGAWQPLTLDPFTTLGDLILGAALVLLFWSARQIVGRGGPVVARGIAWCGLALAIFAILQHVTAPKLMYWLWQPSAAAFPFGPFVNANHLASWLMMAVPLTVGYAVAHVGAHYGPYERDPAATIDARMVWLALSTALMIAALVTTLSRSGFIGMAVGLGLLVGLSRRRLGRRGGGWLLAAVGLLGVVALLYVDLHMLVVRVDQTIGGGLGGRRAIWRDTGRMIRDFWASGVGFGAFERAMLVYQTGSRLFFFNHAHNQYLQFAAEGGVLVGAPAIVAVIAGLHAAVGALARDRTPTFWMRAGAASGLVAVGVQGCWDVGLVIPANAVLFAILAAIALHAPGRDPGRAYRGSGPDADRRSQRGAPRTIREA